MKFCKEKVDHNSSILLICFAPSGLHINDFEKIDSSIKMDFKNKPVDDEFVKEEDFILSIQNGHRRRLIIDYVRQEKEKETLDLFGKHIKFLAKQSRQLIKNLKNSQNWDFDLFQVSAEIDDGLWKSCITKDQFKGSDETSLRSEQKFNKIQANYQEAFRLQNLFFGSSSERKKLPESAVSYIEELYMCYVSLFIMMNRQEA